MGHDTIRIGGPQIGEGNLFPSLSGLIVAIQTSLISKRELSDRTLIQVLIVGVFPISRDLQGEFWGVLQSALDIRPPATIQPLRHLRRTCKLTEYGSTVHSL